ncbi:hypothetical protein CHUAL_000476 [Chamberlinius hualienensis]
MDDSVGATADRFDHGNEPDINMPNVELDEHHSLSVVYQRPLADEKKTSKGIKKLGVDRGLCVRNFFRKKLGKTTRDFDNHPTGFFPSTPIKSQSGSASLSKVQWNSSVRSSSLYCYSPLDKLRTGRRERALQMGLQSHSECSFEANQSFPRANGHLNGGESLSRFQGVESYSYCYSGTAHASGKQPVNCGDFLSGGGSSSAHSLNQSNTATAGSTLYNPLKAVVAVDATSFKIVMVNDAACDLFKLSSESLRSKKLHELFVNIGGGPHAFDGSLFENPPGRIVIISGKVFEAVTSTGEIIPVSVLIRKSDPQRKSKEPTYVVVMEVVQRVTANVAFNQKGEIIENDPAFAKLLGYDIPENLIGLDIHYVIPSILIPNQTSKDLSSKEQRRQYCTGRTKEGVPFPLILIVELQPDQLLVNSKELSKGFDIEDSIDCSENEDQQAENSPCAVDEPQNIVYSGCVWVFANISGMITLRPNGEIHSCNHYFASMLFGYSQQQLIGKNISYLIPSFYDDLKFLDAESSFFPPLDEEEQEGDDVVLNDLSVSAVVSNDLSESLDSVHLHQNSHILQSNGDITHSNAEAGSESFLRDTRLESSSATENTNSQDINGNLNELQKDNESCTVECRNAINCSLIIDCDDRNCSVSTSPKVQNSNDVSPSFPSPPSPIEHASFSITNFKFCNNAPGNQSYPRILEGSFFGSGLHRDGSELPIVYQVRMVELDDGQILFCMWVSRDPDEPAEWFRDNTAFGAFSDFNSIYDDSSINSSDKEEDNCEDSRNSILETPDEKSFRDCSIGAYSTHYSTVEQIGRGAFGCVKLACRKADKILVVTKFIKKEKVFKDYWVNDNNLQKLVPLEVSLLMTLQHPNIIKVLEIYENDNYFQMVMEKHGCGMDLFEFIDRSPNLDEPLASYIFRQIVSAVSYLHGLNILHRDIKDENVIINHQFQVKLIDFGSSAFMSSGHVFSTFCGTFEYCSPEVIGGEKYRGPELEMWTLGVTLYTLVYGENPFRDIEEIIQADLQFPFPMSFDLMRLLSHMLHPDPNLRCTMRELETNPWICQNVDIKDYVFENIVECSRCHYDSSFS